MERLVTIVSEGVELEGELCVPDACRGLVIFVHGSGSSRFSPRNQRVAQALHPHGFATLLVNLLDEDEARIDAMTAEYRFDIVRLGRRLVAIIEWVRREPEIRALPLGLFGGSTGAAVALVAAALRSREVQAVVSRGGRPDLAGDALCEVTAPTLFIVGRLDDAVLEKNREALRDLAGVHRLCLIDGASHLFEEPGTLDEVIARTLDWFFDHLVPTERTHGLSLPKSQ